MRYARTAAVFTVAAAGFAGVLLNGPDRTRTGAAAAARPAAALSTAPEMLDGIIASGRSRVAADPADGEAAVLLADALLRGARVHSDAALALEAERALRATLRHKPDDYPAVRMLGVVLLSQHRFAEALQAAQSAAVIRPADAWNYAVAGDALLELGRYDEAFDTFDRVMALRPDAAAYARVAYARELRGDLDGAARLMQMAAEGTGSHDPEAQAWIYSQLGNIYLHQGRTDDAAREFERAEFTYAGHPYARAGRVRLMIARQQFDQALALVQRGPLTPESLAIAGDLQSRLGDPAAAEAAYRESERLEREGWKQEQAQPAALARFLAERNRRTAEAVSLAETAARERQDINTLDALAWSYYRAGRLDEASAAIAKALRTGSVDPRIRCHANAIAAAVHGRPPAEPDVCNPLTVATRSHR